MNTSDEIFVEIVVPSKKCYLTLIGNISEEIVKALSHFQGDREKLAYQLNLVLTEATTNAIEHGLVGEANQVVRVSIVIDNHDLCMRVYDQGHGFDLDAISVPEPDSLSERGRGFFLIRSLMDSVSYSKLGVGNVLEMRKKIN